MNSRRSLSIIAVLLASRMCLGQVDHNSLPISALVTTDSPGKMGSVAVQSVMRIICTKTSMGGTGFLHKSGWIITAAHVVANCSKSDLLIMLSNGQQSGVDSIVEDDTLDLAIVKPSSHIGGPALALSGQANMSIGTMVTTWGFPSGYNGLVPLLTVGYLSGTDRLPTPNGLSPARWVVNAAFNSGNSGGPVLDIEHGEVVGVVSSKLAPIPPLIESAIEALSNQKSGFMYTKTLSDGTTQSVSEGEVIAEVLKHLRSQTQLVLGHSVTSIDLARFLKSKGISN